MDVVHITWKLNVANNPVRRLDFRIKEIRLHLRLDLLDKFGHLAKNGVVMTRGMVGITVLRYSTAVA